MNLSKEQLKMIAQAIDINEVRKFIQDNLNDYNMFIIEDDDIEHIKQNYPRKDDNNGCSNLCTI